MSDPSTALARVSPGTQAVARVQVERDVRFIGDLTWMTTVCGWAMLLQAALLGSVWVAAAGVAVAAVPRDTRCARQRRTR